MMKQRIYLLVLALVACQTSFAQGFKVKEFQQNISDGSAFHAPLDGAGNPCGLIKIRCENADLKFNGDIVGEIENKTNEYWVYMAQGSKQLKILHPNFIPMHVNFDEYGIGEVTSKATYILTLKEQKYNKEKCKLLATVKPETAELYVDDVFIDNLSGNGLYQLYLPKGDHICRMVQRGYLPFVQAVSIGKGTQNLNVELESVMAELEVKCKTGTAEIYIDGERKGNGSWKGFIFAGEHKIEARQQNFETVTQVVSLAEKENRSYSIPELKRSVGKLSITTVPSNLPVVVDGRSVGMSPCTIEVESGKHYVGCNSYGFIPYRSDVEVNSSDAITATIKMEFDKDNWLIEQYEKAYKGDMEVIKDIVETIIGWIYRGSSNDPVRDSQECVFWLERYSHPEELLDFEGWIKVFCSVGNPEKALQIYHPIKDKVESRGGMFLSESYMADIGEAFLKKKEIDKAIQCFEQAGNYGYEGLGDCYSAKGNKQLAASYYRKSLNSDYYDNKNRVEKKLKELSD